MTVTLESGMELYMQKFESVDDILDFAIGNEEEAYIFYFDLAGEMKNSPRLHDIFMEFADQEKGHKKKLLAAKEGKFLLNAKEKVLDLKLADFLVETEPQPDMSYQDALILAMKKEKKAFALYTRLGDASTDMDVKDLFMFLAQEEAKHKLRLELEYDDEVFKDN